VRVDHLSLNRAIRDGPLQAAPPSAIVYSAKRNDGNAPRRGEGKSNAEFGIHTGVSSVPNNFLGLPKRYSDYTRSQFAVLPIPYDSTTSFQTGTRNGPAAIISASQQVELFDEELEAECYKAGVATLDPLMPNMAGPNAMHEDVFAAAKRIVRDGKFLFGLGGEHSISSALVRAVITRHKKLSVLQIDAHLDLRDSWEGTAHSHACVMRRVHDLGATLVPVGIRSCSKSECAFMNRAAITPITGPISSSCDSETNRFPLSLTRAAQ
jgi:agmatinase